MDMNDRSAWDDSELINTWDEALEEYKKYHSIHLSGKRLEDVLTKEEMAKVYAQRRALRSGQHDRTLKSYDEDEIPEPDGTGKAMSLSPEREVPITVAFDESQAPEQQTAVQAPATTLAEASQSTAAPLSTLMMLGVQDENLKNLLMAWYYAGYHTGMYEGRQQALKELGKGDQA